MATARGIADTLKPCLIMEFFLGAFKHGPYAASRQPLIQPQWKMDVPACPEAAGSGRTLGSSEGNLESCVLSSKDGDRQMLR